MPKDLSEFPIQYIKGVGPIRANLLDRLGIKTVKESLFYLPCRYEDRRNIKKIYDLRLGSQEAVSGKVVSSEIIKLPGRNLRIFELVINDGSSLLTAKWFNQTYMKKTFQIGDDVLLYGTVKKNSYRGIGFEMGNPEYEILTDGEDPGIHLNRIVPVYRVTKGLSVRQMRSIMFHIVTTCIEEVRDTMPAEILKRHSLPGLSESLSQIHFPDTHLNVEMLNSGESVFHKRLSFDELFMLELGLAVMKKRSVFEKGISFRSDGALLNKFIRMLPFKLTQAQQRVFGDIAGDMESSYPMNRLIQGDVGCGKTIVALMAMVKAADCGYQSALMAPTEILAEQHYINLSPLVRDLGLKTGLLTAGVRDKPLEQIAAGGIDMVVGTHALIQEGVQFNKLGLVIIDEQHRFGVMQRALFRKKGLRPDVMVMTATPIPRTLALTLYGDLDYSIIDELPPNRRPVSTRVIPSSQKESVYTIIKEQVLSGRQVYVVYPLIEESEKTDLRSATLGKTAFEKIFSDFRIGLLHGRMKTQEREEMMESFKKGAIDILVSTTVIEVGVDVPNATLMIIIHAERFGLSQLHQLRGRIGRGSHQSYCILLAYAPYGEEARKRLRIMSESSDGFRIAEEDLQIRGPGDFFGTRQSGLPDLRIASIVRDSLLLGEARKEAFAMIDGDPEMEGYPVLRKSVETFWKGKLELFKTA